MFEYKQAFSRNIGWLTTQEQATLRHKRIAIAGMGGVGGTHLLTLTRLGIGAFHIADFDIFELANFNRQAGATLSSLGKPKAQVMADLAKEINPELDIKIFSAGVQQDNLSDFFTGIDLYVDGLDFFAFSARKEVFAACAKLEIPAITVAPLGMGAALLNFLPGGMTFEKYFRWDGCSEEQMALRFMVGLSPAMLQRGYIADSSTINFKAHKGPSTPMACELCAGIAATEALKILLRRDGIIAAPRGVHFDAYRNKLVHTWRPGGNHNPLQRLTIAIARRQLVKLSPPPDFSNRQGIPLSIIEQILDLARWAPSGDNTQPWRFEIVNGHHVVVHGFDTRDDVVYDLDGHASQLAIGALLETIALAATTQGLHTEVIRRPDTPDTHLLFDVLFTSDSAATIDPLAAYIKKRVVQRRPMSTQPLSAEQKAALTAALPEGFQVIWYEGLAQRWRLARFMFDNAKVRLIIPECYQVHKSVIEWGAQFSKDKIPDQAVGIDPLTARFMRWAMAKWERVDFLNTWLLGDLPPRIQLDLLPGLGCAAHFALLAPVAMGSVDDYLAAGRAMQKFWLTATHLGLYIQPEMTPVIFTRYQRQAKHFTQTPRAQTMVQDLDQRLAGILADRDVETLFFMGRIGAGPAPQARSTRRPLDQLVIK